MGERSDQLITLKVNNGLVWFRPTLRWASLLHACQHVVVMVGWCLAWRGSPVLYSGDGTWSSLEDGQRARVCEMKDQPEKGLTTANTPTPRDWMWRVGRGERSSRPGEASLWSHKRAQRWRLGGSLFSSTHLAQEAKSLCERAARVGTL